MLLSAAVSCTGVAIAVTPVGDIAATTSKHFAEVPDPPICKGHLLDADELHNLKYLVPEEPDVLSKKGKPCPPTFITIFDGKK